MSTQSELFARSLIENQDTISGAAVTERQIQDATPIWKQLDYFVRNSDIAFRGVVSNIQYKMANPSEKGQAQVPYTYVTYDIKEVIHGEVEGKQVVLRFIGGLDEKTMRVVSASNVSNCDLNDDDILFVQGNTHSISPLVLNDRGRFRVVEWRVYSDSGREITLDDKNQLQYGKRHRLQEILTTSVSGSQGTMVMENKINPDAVQQPSRSISADELIVKIREIGIPAKKTARFVNADIYSELTGPSIKPTVIPKANINQQEELKTAPDKVIMEIGEIPTKRQLRRV